MSKIIETVIITPTKEMPLEVYKKLHRISSFFEIMERTEDGKVIWNEDATELYSEELAEAEWYGLQEDLFSIDLEVPKEMIESE